MTGPAAPQRYGRLSIAMHWLMLALIALAAEDKDLAKRVRGWHGDAGRIGYALIALHAAAALLHHRVWRDNTLVRMLPGR